jgi:putative thioredoxin
VQLDLAEIHLDGQQLDAARAILDAAAHQGANRYAGRAAGKAEARRRRRRRRSRRCWRHASLPTATTSMARLQLAHALALAQDYRAALEQLLEIVRRDRKWQDEAARKTMLDLFTLLGATGQFDELVREFRIRLARTLN